MHRSTNWMKALCASFVILALALLSGCASLPTRVPSPAVHALTDVKDTRLARIATAAARNETPDLSGFRLLPVGEYAFGARIVLARRAEKSLDVQYYLIQNDEVGRAFLRELRDAASRGVRVRLLVDDLYAAGADELLAGLAAYPNAEVRIFNPLPVRGDSLAMRVLFSLHQFGRVNRRMHNKLFVADNTFAVSGGRNIASEYFMRSETANFIDLDVLSSGPVVRALSDVFDSYWNSQHVYPIGTLITQGPPHEAARQRFDELVRDAAPDVAEPPRDILGHTPVAQQLDSGELDQVFARAQVFADTPDKVAGNSSGSTAPTVTDKTLAMFAVARKEVQIVSPYFIAGERGMKLMRAVGATDAEGQITLVTNSLGATDEPLVYAGYERYRLDMLKAGVRIYELSPSLSRRSGRLGNFRSSSGRLHAKAAVIDRRWVLIGSMNLDPRSALLNTESSLAIDSPELAIAARSLGEDTLNSGAYRLRLSADGERIEWLEKDPDGKVIVHLEEPDDSWLLRLRIWLFSKFIAEDQL
jgi:putative cardiolipin synthase